MTSETATIISRKSVRTPMFRLSDRLFAAILTSPIPEDSAEIPQLPASEGRSCVGSPHEASLRGRGRAQGGCPQPRSQAPAFLGAVGQLSAIMDAPRLLGLSFERIACRDTSWRRPNSSVRIRRHSPAGSLKADSAQYRMQKASSTPPRGVRGHIDDVVVVS